MPVGSLPTGWGVCLRAGDRPSPWHCGRADPLWTDRHLWKHYLPASHFCIRDRYVWMNPKQQKVLHLAIPVMFTASLLNAPCLPKYHGDHDLCEFFLFFNCHDSCSYLSSPAMYVVCAVVLLLEHQHLTNDSLLRFVLPAHNFLLNLFMGLGEFRVRFTEINM